MDKKQPAPCQGEVSGGLNLATHACVDLSKSWSFNRLEMKIIDTSGFDF